MNKYSHILRAVSAEAWAMYPPKMHEAAAFLELKFAGVATDAATRAAAHEAGIQAAARSQNVAKSGGGAVAVLPLFGTIMRRGNMMSDLCGPSGTSVEQFTQQFRAAMNDPNVSNIALVIDSGGGCVSGVPELAAEILAGKKQKPIVAVVDSLCASAAYWIAASCSEIYVTPSSLTGSVGVYTVHEDLSGAYEQAGVKLTFVYFGDNKVKGNDAEPLDDDTRADMQARVDYYGAMFEKAVAKGRGIKAEDVHSKFGQGKVFNAQKAVSSGMADKVGTLDDVLMRFGVGRGSGGANARADGDVSDVAAAEDDSILVSAEAWSIEHEHRARELELLSL